MLTKEEYEKTFIRMMDSMRQGHITKGTFTCAGIICDECPLYNSCGNAQMAYEAVEVVENWGKEHPIVTNADKFKEVFGYEPNFGSGGYICPGSGSNIACTTCHYGDCMTCKRAFWEAEYKAPEKEEE